VSQRAEKILIVNLTRLGDLLQTSPVIEGLKRSRPGCEITLLAEKSFAEVCEGIPALDRIYRIDLDTLGAELLEGGAKLLSGFNYVRRVIDDLRGEGFSLGLNYSSSKMTAVFMGLLRIADLRGWTMTKDGFRVIAHPWSRLFASMCLNRRFAVYNLVDYYLRMADIRPFGGGLYYRISDQARAGARRVLREAGWREGEKLVAIQLGASRSARCWAQRSFVELGREISASLGMRVVLIGGRLDRELAARTHLEMGGVALNLCGATSIAELGGVLEQCEALITGDTGPMHMAVAMKTPVIGLFFGPASAFDTGPYSEGNVVLQCDVACAPCDHSVNCLRPFCREEISAAMVARALQLRLEGRFDDLAREASKWSSVRVFRTTFDRQGFYRCEPLGERPAKEEDLVREAYRCMWVAELDGEGKLHEAGLRLDREIGSAESEAKTSGFLWGFGKMVSLAREGCAQASLLAGEAAKRDPSVSRCEELGEKIDAIDREIAKIAGIVPATAPLWQMFRFGKENLEGEELEPLARATSGLYAELARRAGAMSRLLGEKQAEFATWAQVCADEIGKGPGGEEREAGEWM